MTTHVNLPFLSTMKSPTFLSLVFLTAGTSAASLLGHHAIRQLHRRDFDYLFAGISLFGVGGIDQGSRATGQGGNIRAEEA